MGAIAASAEIRPAACASIGLLLRLRDGAGPDRAGRPAQVGRAPTKRTPDGGACSGRSSFPRTRPGCFRGERPTVWIVANGHREHRLRRRNGVPRQRGRGGGGGASRSCFVGCSNKRPSPRRPPISAQRGNRGSPRRSPRTPSPKRRNPFALRSEGDARALRTPAYRMGYEGGWTNHGSTRRLEAAGGVGGGGGSHAQPLPPPPFRRPRAPRRSHGAGSAAAETDRAETGPLIALDAKRAAALRRIADAHGPAARSTAIGTRTSSPRAVRPRIAHMLLGAPDRCATCNRGAAARRALRSHLRAIGPNRERTGARAGIIVLAHVSRARRPAERGEDLLSRSLLVGLLEGRGCADVSLRPRPGDGSEI